MTKTFAKMNLPALDRLASLLGTLCLPRDIICLGGGLGAGKTTFTQALARGAGIDSHEYVCSPTFSFMHEYQGDIPMYHMDFYRLGSSDDIIEHGLDEYLYRSGIAVIEWYERGKDLIPENHLQVLLDIIDYDHRKITLSSTSDPWQERLALIESTFKKPA